MAYAFTGEMSIGEYFDEALRQISGVVEAVEYHPDLRELDDEALADHFLKPKNGGGWELAPLEITEIEVVPDAAVRLDGTKVPQALARLHLKPHPNNPQALLIRPEGEWPPHASLGRAASFSSVENIIEIHSAKSEIAELESAAEKAISLINAEIEAHSPEFRYRLLALIADYRSRKAEEAAEFAKLRREMGIVEHQAKSPESRAMTKTKGSPKAEKPNVTQSVNPQSVASLAKVVATLSAIRKHAHDWVYLGIVREYDDQLKVLEKLGYDVDEWRVPYDDLKPFVYASDESDNALSHSRLEFVDRPALMTRLEPALEFASGQLEQRRASHADQAAIEAVLTKVEHDAALRFGRRDARGNIVKLMDLLLRLLKGTEDRLDELSIPARHRDQLRAWIRKIGEGNLSDADWTTLSNDLDDLFEHIRDKVDGHPDQDFYALPPVQQHLLSMDGFIDSTMYDIEILQWQDLQSGLDAFNRTRQKAPSSSESATAVSVAGAAAEPVKRRPVVCIGHGRSLLWYPLAWYLEKDLGVEVRPFEFESHVGESPREFLEGLVDGADCAIVLLTGEDEQADGDKRARQNVVHETGFFQKEFGFKRVAILIQRGVEEPSNIAGIITIRFDDQNIEQTFVGISRWLRREGLLP